MVKNLRAMREDLILILGLGRSLGEGNGYPLQDSWGILGGSDGKESACNTEDLGLIPGSGRSPGEGNDNPLQYSCLANFMDRPWSCKESDTTEQLSFIQGNFSEEVTSKMEH